MTDKTDNDVRFLFSLSASQHAQRDLTLRINAAEERIEQIIRKATIKSMPIAGNILSLTENPDELTKLGNALLKLAKIYPHLEELKRRKAVIELAAEDPEWMMAIFGDFTDEVDNLSMENLPELDNGGD